MLDDLIEIYLHRIKTVFFCVTHNDVRDAKLSKTPVVKAERSFPDRSLDNHDTRS